MLESPLSTTVRKNGSNLNPIEPILEDVKAENEERKSMKRKQETNDINIEVVAPEKEKHTNEPVAVQDKNGIQNIPNSPLSMNQSVSLNTPTPSDLASPALMRKNTSFAARIYDVHNFT